MRAALWAPACALLLSACAHGPGQHVDEDNYARPGEKSEDPNEPQLVPITPSLLVEQAQAQMSVKRPATADPLAATVASHEYRVRPHDVLSVIVWDHPELTIPAGEFRSAEATGHPVTADGRMFYPHVGSVEVAGKTMSEIREMLTQRLARIIQNPQLDVRVASFRSQKVQVTGQVVAPSTLPITDVPLYALDAISVAKGFSPEADPSNVTLTREGKTYTLDLQALNERGDVSQNWLLQNGDLLHVPDRSTNRVFVLGEVRRPSSRPMVLGRMTLADAIGDSEGLDPLTSNAARIYVIRGVMNRPVVYKLDASDPAALLLAVQFQLKPQDVVFVSAHNLTRWNRIMQQILPTIQGLYQTSLAGQRLTPIINP
jgi:polysaccharide biosynthesis/export protein